MIKAVLFDADGTLLDSMPVWKGLGQRYLQTQGIIAAAGLDEQLQQLSLLQAAEYVKDTYHLRKSSGEIMTGFEQLIQAAYEHQVALKPGVKEYLQLLKTSGVLLYVATASAELPVRTALQRAAAADYFEAVLTCTRLNCAKSEPLFFKKAAAFCGLECGQVLVFEDSLYAASAAKAAGCKVIGVYDQAGGAEEEHMRRVCDQYIMSFTAGPHPQVLEIEA